MTSHYVLVLLVAALASARTYRLLTIDDIMIPVRNVVYRGPQWLQAAWTCPYCSGFYWAVGWSVTGIFWADNGPWWWLAAGPFAANYVSATLNAFDDIRPIKQGGGEIPPEPENSPDDSE